MMFLESLGNWVLQFSARAQSLNNSRTSMFERPDLPQVGDRMWTAVGHLLKRAWFKRVWIVQEAVLAAELIIGCGSKTMPWEVLHAATALCFMKGLWNPTIECPIADQRTQKNILQLGNLRARLSSNGQFTPCDYMFDLLQLFHQKDVTKPRDRLFALLGMAKDGSEERLRPRYDVKDEKIITDYGSVFVEQGYGLDLLYQARMASEREGLPSWVPNLIAHTYPNTITAWGERVGDETFKAAGDEPSPKNGVVIDKALYLRGYEVDMILHLGNYASSIDDVFLFIEEIFAYIDEVYGSIPNQERQEVRCRLPIGDTHKPTTPSWDPDDRANGTGYDSATRMDSYHNVLLYLDYRRGRPSKPEPTAIQEAGQANYIASHDGLIRRRLWPYYQTVIEFAQAFQPASAVVCETKMGRVGIVPDAAFPATDGTPGDKIVIFEGAKVPYIIRKSSTTPETYQAVGECYIDGIMHGELFGDGKQRSGLQLQKFRLE